MKSKILFSCALLSFFAGLGVLIAAWNGNASVKAAWPISASVVEFSGSATGWRAVAGLGGMLVAVFFFLWALLSLVTGTARRKSKDLPPPPDLEVKREAASH